ncbi:MmgE/PrpD family protein [Algoriphagus sp. NG3]|uniref:MmgE/PrpD family protein n=1 Tax=Algoriphagus sp. NG3 TaxID=3097546 RepID=UPI002A83D3FE|nr:MmgE/PrpD family protein [Algoriphagus sp. NG3]WPR77835.1 MmgE/PrpD family protein [Algoriphagus sp. NG3]
MSSTNYFVKYLYDLGQSEISDNIVKQAKRCLLDYLGVTIAGSKMINIKGEGLLSLFEDGSLGESAIGFDRKTSTLSAALINGMSGHVAELDDGVRFGGLHPGVPVISALLAIAEKERIDGKKLIAGIVTGYEAAIRLSVAIQPAHKKLGFHATGTCGTIGAAIGVATALNYPMEMMSSAFSAAATSASGILKATGGSSELKPYNAGQAALNGIVASFVARAGFSGPGDVLDGDKGLLAIFSNGEKASKLMGFSSAPLAIEMIYFKPYAACRHSHPAIEAVLKLRNLQGIRAEDVQSIEVTTYDLAIEGHDHKEIAGVTSAKMSTPYGVAIALIDGKADIGQFASERINDPAVLSLVKKVNMRSDHSLSQLVPQKRPAIVEVITVDNRRLIEQVDLPKGEPENPISEGELKGKFLALARYGGKTQQECSQIIEHVENLEDKLGTLYNLL